MPLTARHEMRVLDATICSDAEFDAVRKQRPRVLLLCPGCGYSMHAARSRNGLAFFRHDATQPTCPSNGETAIHRLLKAELAHSIRRAGWTAELEVPRAVVADGGGRWKADVLATDPVSNRQVAFEVQISSQTVEVGQYRTDRYAQDGIETYWVAGVRSWWLWKLPGFQVDTTRPAGGLIVIRGLAKYGHHPIDLQRGTNEWSHLRWLRSPEVSLDKTVAAILDGELVAHHLTGLNDGLRRGDSTWGFPQTTVLALVSPNALAREAEMNERERLEREERAREKLLLEEQWLAYMADQPARIRAEKERTDVRHRFYESQARVLRQVQALLEAALGGDEVVLVGDPPRSPDTPPRSFVPVISYDEPAHWVEYPLNGSDHTAEGAALWIKSATEEPQLKAVVCPEIALLNESLATSWRRGGVQIYAETHDEAARIAAALRWPVSEVLVTGTEAHTGRTLET